MSGYWERISQSRLSRRTAVARLGVAGAGVAALSLVGCGGDSSSGSNSSSGASNGLVTNPEDTTAKAKAGGTLKTFASADATSFDPIGDGTSTVYGQISAYAYLRLLKFATAKYPKTATGDVEPDGAESYEVSPDKMQVTFKIRQGQKWDPRAPTNGRVMDAQDVLATWNRFAKVSPNKADVIYDAAIAPFGPVDTVSAPDNNTVIFKLKTPDASFLPLIAYNRNFYIMPKEADGGFDPRKDIRGNGPWTLANAVPSAGRTWKRNADYYVKGRPFSDSIEVPVVSEYATQLAQFKAGNIYTSVARQEDVVQTKGDVPGTILGLDSAYSGISSVVVFGYDGDSPFKDERVRQAVSRAIDRETLANVINNRDKLKADGLDLQTRYHTIINASWEGFWIDPLDSKKFGPNGVFYQYSIAESKKLLAAAGFPNGFDTNLFYNGGTQYGTTYSRSADLLAGMLPDIGIRAKQSPKDYQTEYLPNYHYAYTP
ncbi:MAG TPA: ABC transporter substrate-binding protein, partial [Dehalococcoidia bacterium]